MRRLFWLLIPAIVATTQLGCPPAQMQSSGPEANGAVYSDRVLFLLGEDYDPQEFWGPYSAICAAGYKVDLAGSEKGIELTPDSDLPEANIRTNVSIDDVKFSKYLALVVPGGPSAANIAQYPRARQIATEFDKAGKLIGTVCHGARLLMPQGIFKNRQTTCVFMVADELCDQWKNGDYGMYLDLPVVMDKNLVCSRDPRDIPAMSKALVERFAQSGGLPVPQRSGKVLIILPAATKHQRWVLDRLGIFGLSPTVLNQEQVEKLEPGDKTITQSDMLVIFNDAGIEKLNTTDMASLVDSFSKSGKTILVSETAKPSLPNIDLTKANIIKANNIADAMKKIVNAAQVGKNAETITWPNSTKWAENYVKAATKPITASPWDPATEYDAVLALWSGYDDDAAFRMNDFLASVSNKSGNKLKVLVVGRQKGTLTGLNGSKAQVTATYDDQIKLSSNAIVVAPGGVWPKKTKAQQAVQPKWVEDDEQDRQKRLNWLIGQYKSGKMLVAFGFDSLHIGQLPAFKGMQFASTDQASVIWFGDKGAQYSPEKALLSATNLLTVKPLVGVDDAMKLLQEYMKNK